MDLTQEQLLLLQGTKLFAGIGAEKLLDMLACLNARLARYHPEEFVVREGDEVTEVGIVLAGHAHSMKENSKSQPLIISLLERGSFIGVLLAASRTRASPVSVQAKEELLVLFFQAERLITPCPKGCGQHGELLRNYLDSIAEKSLMLNDRIGCLLRRSVREKVLTYLARVAAEKNSREFTIPLDRSGLADYLNIERSALSRELSRMRQDGLIQYRKNLFRLL